MGRLILFILLILPGFSGCFDAPKPPCSFQCGEGGECPEGYDCAPDNFCKRPDVAPNFVCPGADLTPDAAAIDAGIPDA